MLLSLVLPGCGGSKFPVRPCKGKVLCDGKPLASGSVTFTPISDDQKIETGKQASGTLNSEGVFVLSTYGRFDGAIVGKHSVQFSGAGQEDTEEESSSEEDEDATGKSKLNRQAKKPKPECVQKEEIILEVTATGENDFTIELTPRK